jgi:DNA gyrase subunit A
MRVEEGAQIVGMDVGTATSELFLLSADGRAKRTPLKDFPRQGRYGKGVLAWKSEDEIELAGACAGQPDDRAVAHLARAAARSIRLGDAPRRARAGSGKLLFEVKENDRIVRLSPAVARAVLPEPEPKPAPAETKATGRGKTSRSKGKPARKGGKPRGAGGARPARKAPGKPPAQKKRVPPKKTAPGRRKK